MENFQDVEGFFHGLTEIYQMLNEFCRKLTTCLLGKSWSATMNDVPNGLNAGSMLGNRPPQKGQQVSKVLRR